MSGENKVDSVEKEKRIYQISLLLTRKPKPFIREYMKQNWNLKRTQIYRYIKLAEKEWEKYYTDFKRYGMGYYFAKRREVRDKAMEDKDYRLVLETDKDEAKLAGIYPAEKHEITERKVIVIGKKEKKDDEAK